MEVEQANFRAALVWSQNTADHEIGLCMALALGEFWWRRGHLSEGIGWLTGLLMKPQIGPPTEVDRVRRGWALDWLATFNIVQGDLDTAAPRLEESLALFREVENGAGMADALSKYGMLFVVRGDHG